jgi:hypothetical protein
MGLFASSAMCPKNTFSIPMRGAGTLGDFPKTCHPLPSTAIHRKTAAAEPLQSFERATGNRSDTQGTRSDTHVIGKIGACRVKQFIRKQKRATRVPGP